MNAVRQPPGYCVNHHDRPAVAGCRHCGDFFCAECAPKAADGVCRGCTGEGSDNPASLWERERRASGPVKVLWAVLTRPGGLFASMPRGRGARFAYLYAAMTLFCAALITTALTWLVRGGPFPWLVPVNTAGLAGLLIVDAALIFGLGRLYDRRLAFPDALRVVSYGATAYLFLVVPVFGPLLILALGLAYLTVGAHRGLHLGVPQAVSLALAPLLVRLGAAWLIYGGGFWERVAG